MTGTAPVVIDLTDDGPAFMEATLTETKASASCSAYAPSTVLPWR